MYEPSRVSTRILSPVLTNSGTLIVRPVSRTGGLVAAGGGVALEARLGLRHFEDDVQRHVHADGLLVVHEHVELHAVLEVVDGVAELRRRERELLVAAPCP